MSDNFPTDPVASKGRASNGQFATGNKFGPGNPYGRKTAALRKALLEAVTEQDIQDIATILLLNAKAGDLASIKLLFSYVIGKPQPAVNPDTLDAQELRGWQEGTLTPEGLDQLHAALPLHPVLDFLPIFKDGQGRQLAEEVRQQLAASEEKEVQEEKRPETKAQRKRRRRAAQEKARQHRQQGQAAPSVNGGNGAPGHGAPSVNERNREPAQSFFQRWLGGR